MSKLAKYESDTSDVSEDIALQSREILQTFCGWRKLTIQLSVTLATLRMHNLVSFQ